MQSTSARLTRLPASITRNDIHSSALRPTSAIAIVIRTLAGGTPTPDPAMVSDADRARGSESLIRPVPAYVILNGPTPATTHASNLWSSKILVMRPPGTQLSSAAGSCSSRNTQSGSRSTRTTAVRVDRRSEEHTSELQSQFHLV